MKVIVMDGPVSLSTQHKLPVTVLGKSQEKLQDTLKAL